MSIIKSFSVGDGDMFYIIHGSSNFTIIDCFLDDTNQESIVNEIIDKRKNKDITRFISTHPDKDHIGGLKFLDSKLGILNFYCVENSATKADESRASGNLAALCAVSRCSRRADAMLTAACCHIVDRRYRQFL